MVPLSFNRISTDLQKSCFVTFFSFREQSKILPLVSKAFNQLAIFAREFQDWKDHEIIYTPRQHSGIIRIPKDYYLWKRKPIYDSELKLNSESKSEKESRILELESVLAKMQYIHCFSMQNFKDRYASYLSKLKMPQLESLDLEFRGPFSPFIQENQTELANFLIEHPQLSMFSLEISDQTHFEYISKTIDDCSARIVNFTFPLVKVVHRGFEHTKLMSILTKSPKLKEILLIEKVSTKMLDCLIENCKELKSIQFSALKRLTSLEAKRFHEFHDLECFSFHFQKKLCEELLCHSNLKSIKVYFNHLRLIDEASTITISSNSITDLHISYTRDYPDETLADRLNHFFSFIGNSFPKLKSFTIDIPEKLYYNSLILLARGCPQLEKITFLSSTKGWCNYPIMFDGIEALCQMKNLRYLKVPNTNQIREGYFKPLIKNKCLVVSVW